MRVVLVLFLLLGCLWCGGGDVVAGYALSQAEFAIIVRYREPNPDWEGNPANAQCYQYINQSVPLTYSQLGVYTPQAFGGSFADFLAGTIGIVNKNDSWPESLTPSPSTPPTSGSSHRFSLRSRIIIGCAVSIGGCVLFMVLGLWVFIASKTSTSSSTKRERNTEESRETVVEMGTMRPSQFIGDSKKWNESHSSSPLPAAVINPVASPSHHVDSDI